MPRDGWWLARRRLSQEDRARQAAMLTGPWLRKAKAELEAERRPKGGWSPKGWSRWTAAQRRDFKISVFAAENLSSEELFAFEEMRRAWSKHGRA